jgi:hypothetical protein
VWLIVSATGSGFAAAMLLTTLTFLITTPVWETGWGASRCCPARSDSS